MTSLRTAGSLKEDCKGLSVPQHHDRTAAAQVWWAGLKELTAVLPRAVRDEV